MSKKTLALIISLVGITVVLFAVALISNKQSTPTEPTPTAVQPTPTPAAQSLLLLSPNPVEMTSSRSASVDVTLDTVTNKATAIQLEIAYDPQVLTNFSIKPGPLFSSNQVPPDNIINTNDTKNGRITYALVLPLSQPAVTGKGVVATISFTQRAILPETVFTQGGMTQLQLLPKSLVTAEGVAKSVLKQATGTSIMLYNPSVTTPGASTTTTAPTTPSAAPF